MIDGSLIVDNCTLSYNQCDSNGGAITIQGEALIKDSKLLHNSSRAGGALLNQGSSTVTNCIIAGNVASRNGGGIANDRHIRIHQTLIFGNLSAYGGGFSGGAASFSSSTISGNAATTKGGGVSGGGIGFRNTIVAKNVAPFGQDIAIGFGVGDFGNNLIGDTTGIGTPFTLSTLIGNTAHPVDPSFIEAVDTSSIPTSIANLRLSCHSIAIDAGSQDTTGLHLPLFDLEGNERIQGLSIDVGAYESMVPCEVIPTLAQWYVINLSLIMLIMGVLWIKAVVFPRSESY